MRKISQITTASLKISILALLFIVTAAPHIRDYGGTKLHQENASKGGIVANETLLDAVAPKNGFNPNTNAVDGSVRAFKKNSNNIVLDTQAPSATLGRISTGQPVETPSVAVDLKDLAGSLKDGEEITKNRAIVGGGMNPISRGDMVHDPKVNSSMHQGAMNSVQDRN